MPVTLCDDVQEQLMKTLIVRRLRRLARRRELWLLCKIPISTAYSALQGAVSVVKFRLPTIVPSPSTFPNQQSELCSYIKYAKH